MTDRQIVKQFKDGLSIEALSRKTGIKDYEIESIIRKWMIENPNH